jgi:hypothetical protein
MIRIALTIVLLLVVVSHSIVLAAEPPELIIRNVQIIKPGEWLPAWEFRGRVAATIYHCRRESGREF